MNFNIQDVTATKKNDHFEERNNSSSMSLEKKIMCQKEMDEVFHYRRAFMALASDEQWYDYLVALVEGNADKIANLSKTVVTKKAKKSNTTNTTDGEKCNREKLNCNKTEFDCKIRESEMTLHRKRADIVKADEKTGVKRKYTKIGQNSKNSINSVGKKAKIKSKKDCGDE